MPVALFEESLAMRPHGEFEAPGSGILAAQGQVGLGHRVDVKKGFVGVHRIARPQVGRVENTVDDDMGDVRPEFASQRPVAGVGEAARLGAVVRALRREPECRVLLRVRLWKVPCPFRPRL